MTDLLLIVIVVVGLLVLRSYNKRIRKLENRLLELQNALAGHLLSAGISESTDGAKPAASITATDSSRPPTEAAKEPVAEAEQIAATESAGVAARIAAEQLDGETVAHAAQPGPASDTSLESRLGARWAVWVGGIALAFGGIFMVKYSIESGLLSPAVRLALAALFGLALIAAGEIIRRGFQPVLSSAFRNAMVPGVLTAAGVVALFGSTYSAHGIYGFIGPTTAFLLLAAISLAALGLSLLHGQALAGFGLLASMITPMLVADVEPKPWPLFGYLVLTWLATIAASRLRRWRIVPSLANVFLCAWALLYLAQSSVVDLAPITLALLAMIAGVIFLWPGRYETVTPTESETAETEGQFAPAAPGHWAAFLARAPLGITLTASIGAAVVSLSLLGSYLFGGYLPADAPFAFAAIVAALAAFGASRPYAAWATVLSAISAVAGMALLACVTPSSSPGELTPAAVSALLEQAMLTGLGLGAVFVIIGMFFLRRFAGSEKFFASLWSVIIVATPLSIAVISYIGFGNWTRDWLHGLYGVGLGIVLILAAEWQYRRFRDDGLALPTNILAAGSFAAFVFALHTLAHDAVTTVLVPVVGMTYLYAARIRPWRVLPWMMVAALVIIMGRIAWQPSIVDPSDLGTTPILNMLLVGYGVPAALAAWSAYEQRLSPRPRLRNALQALASFLVLLTIAILVRHAMNGGTLNANVPTLGEQAIYTLLAIGASATLMALDLSASSPVFRYGSMAIGIGSVLLILTVHLFALNPFVTGENTGTIPFFNLLLLGYLLPAVGYAGLALYARRRRPLPYVMMLSAAGALMIFAWATLSVRRFWQGAYIPFWNGFIQGEVYSYSVVWLLIGIALLGLGARFNAPSLRIASAALVLAAVVKVFLVDMANLEGFLRALSFIGLGVVLIGIGLFYQKVLTGKKATE